MRIEHTAESIVIFFSEKQRALSSSVFGGGLREVETILNLHARPEEISAKHPELIIRDFFDKNRALIRSRSSDVIGLLTAAPFEHAQFVLLEENDIRTLAAVTAGTSNALNASERSSTFYTGGQQAGTINIIFITDACLTDDCMVSSVITATEAKSAALIKLGVKSTVSGSQATGTGTDAVVIVSGRGRPIKYAGGHTQFGQMLGESVFLAVRDALLKKKTAPENLDLLCEKIPL